MEKTMEIIFFFILMDRFKFKEDLKMVSLKEFGNIIIVKEN